MQMENIFSLSVSAATLPNPTEVMQVIVQYKAVTYIVLRLGPPMNSIFEIVSLSSLNDTVWVQGCWLMLARVQSQPYSMPLIRSELPIEYLKDRIRIINLGSWDQNSCQQFQSCLIVIKKQTIFTVLKLFQHLYLCLPTLL